MIFNMKLADSKQIKEIDRLSSRKFGISSQIRMEVAGLKSYEIINREYAPKNTLLIIGTGNNGGDGLVVARYLKLNKHKCSIFIVNTSKIKSKDFLDNFSIANRLGIEIVKNWKDVKLRKYDLIIDSIFGVGLNRSIVGNTKKIIDKLNKIKIPICSIDIPSGLNPDDGQIFSTCIVSDCTITFDFAKPGLLTDPGAKFSKKVFIVKLPTPDILAKNLNNHFIDESYFTNFFKTRDVSSNKGTFGHVMIIGGSKNMSGAVALSALAAYKSGSGLVTLCVPKSISNTLKNKLPEAIILDIPDSPDNQTMDENEFLRSLKDNIRKKPSAVVIGPGLGNRKGLLKVIKDSLSFFDCPIIIDADGLNLISKNLDILSKSKNKVIITPHPGEMSKLSRQSIKLVQENRIKTSKKLSSKMKCISILKGFRTIISNPSGEIYINSSGNVGMATGGMGDALTGIIASFIGQGYSTINSSILGVFVHGKAGDRIASKDSKRGILATQVIKELPKLIFSLEKDNNFAELTKINNE